MSQSEKPSEIKSPLVLTYPTFLFPGERYVYKFVCDPDALFQMALAENHRTALKMEATCIAAATTGTSANNSGTNEKNSTGPG